MARQGRRGQRKPRETGRFKQPPWRRISNPYKPIEVLREEQIEQIHTASLDVLENLGLEFLDGEALDILERAGADVDHASKRVRFDRGLITDAIAKAPSSFTIHARNPARDIVMGGNHISFSPVGSPPNCSDLDKGRRTGTYEDYCNLLRISHSLNIIHLISGYPVEPVDLPPATRHLDAYYGYITLTDRAWHPYSLGHDRIADGIDMLCIARGIDRAQIKREPSLVSVINTNSPLRVDGPMLQGMMEMVRNGQPPIVTPFTLSGAMAPVTIAGALAQQNAEALAVIALTQMINPGCPVIYGGFTSNVDMKSGAPAFGTPEYSKAALAGGQLARRYNLPYRSSNVNSANLVDAQAAYESEMSIWAAVMGHANLVMHGAGWLEGGLCASFEKMIIDAEMLQMMAAFLEPIEVNDATLGLDAMAEAGPGGHFFGTAHTLERYETAFYEPIVSDWRNFETWEEHGSQTATQRANGIWKKILEEYEQPPLDEARDEALKDFIARRKRDGGAIAA